MNHSQPKNRNLSLAIAGILSALTLAACGGGSSDAPTPTVTTPPPPVAQTNRAPVISGTPVQGKEAQAYSFTPTFSDPDGDSLSLSITNKPSWANFDTTTGELSGIPSADNLGDFSNIKLTVSDGKLSSDLSFSITINYDELEEAVRSGNASLVDDETQYLDAVLETIENNRTLFTEDKAKLFNLNADGSSNANSLLDIVWDPTHDAALLNTTFGSNTEILLSNSVTNTEYDVKTRTLGIIGKTNTTPYMVLGSNPMRNAYRSSESVNAQMHQLLKNSFAWMLDRNDLETKSFKVVLSQLSQSYYFPDQVATRTWLDQHFSGMASYNSAESCNGSALLACLTSDVDLLIISQVLFENDDARAIKNTVEQALANGTPVLYMHHNGNNGVLGKELFPLFRVKYLGDNYWRKLQIQNSNVLDSVNTLSADNQNIQNLMQHFKDNDFTVDLSACNDKSCPDEGSYSNEFKSAAQSIQVSVQSLDSQKVNLFQSDEYRFEKLLVLLADHYRQKIAFPMDKVKTDTKEFLQSLFADHVIYNNRPLNPVQPDLGNFSRSDFSHVTPSKKTISVQSKPNFRSAGVYALPGQTFTVKRTDHSAVQTKIFINTLRSGATHEFNEDAYNRPKFLKTVSYLIEPNETLSLTSSSGGPIQVSFDTKDLPVELEFTNIGEHPYWNGSEDNESFAQALEAGDYDWAEMVTPSFEVHSKLDKMRNSVANEKWGSVAELSAGTERYLHNFPHVLAGFKGPGIDVVPEIHNFATANGLEIQTLDKVKHMNADQATCGYGCSGNPYDAYWSYDPLGHGDLHELGHGLERGRFRYAGWELHAVTNPYSYYAKSQYYKDTGAVSACQKLPFKNLFETLQTSMQQTDPFAYMQAADLGVWNQGVAINIQIMMSAQAQGVLENGWHLLARLHILDREFSAAVRNDELWLAKRDGLGFAGISRTDANAFSNNDWLLISVSHALGLDMRDYLNMWGFDYSVQAASQVEGFAYNPMRKEFYISGQQDYCLGFDKAVLPVDGNQVWPE